MRVLVVDDNPVMRAGLNAMLHRMDDIDVVEAADGRQALAILAKPGGPPVDLVFLDVRMPGMDGLATLERIQDVPVVMLTNADDADTIRTAMDGGAKGYLINGEFTEAELAAALTLCCQGGMMLTPTAAARAAAPPVPVSPNVRYGLTDREQALMQALLDGLTNPQIAKRLFVSEHTVKNQLNHIYTKMGVTSRSQAILAWLQE